PAGALVVLGRPEDAGAEEAVPLGLERAVVDGLGLLHLPVRPVADLLRRRQLDADGAEGHGFRVAIEDAPEVPRRLLLANEAAECRVQKRSGDVLLLCAPGWAGPGPRRVQRLMLFVRRPP